MSKSKTFLFNPTEVDFVFQYDIKGDRNPKGFTIHALEGEEFSKKLINHAEKHLITHVMNDRDLNPLLPEHREDILKEIHMEI